LGADAGAAASAADFETSLTALYEKVLKPEGFQLQSVSRLPYLSEGEYDCPLFTLDDGIVVLSVPSSAAVLESAEPPSSAYL
jgi:hypothetical protein